MIQFSKIISFCDDRINPIVVKELRQNVQSSFVSFIVNFLLAALVVISMGVLMSNFDQLQNTGGGRELFMVLQGALFIAAMYQSCCCQSN